jgi:hypothetical protein
MKFTLAILAFAATVLALPAPPTGKSAAAPPAGAASCTFSGNEKLNLGHNHDVNTGKIKVGKTISSAAPKIGGSGCSPAWAVGGAIDDNTPTKTKVGAQKGAA